MTIPGNIIRFIALDFVVIDCQLVDNSLSKYPPDIEIGMKSVMTTDVPVIKPPPGKPNASRFDTNSSWTIQMIINKAYLGRLIIDNNNPMPARTRVCFPEAAVKKRQEKSLKRAIPVDEAGDSLGIYISLIVGYSQGKVNMTANRHKTPKTRPHCIK